MQTTTNPLRYWLTAALAALLAIAALPAQADETITYIHWDALGSPVAATDEAGNVVWREGYRPYGQRTNNEAAAADNSRWYTGHPQDADTGLVYAGARYYDPTIGRFLGIDPVGVQADNLHSFNRYAYANNNPYGYVDPDGREGIGAAFVMEGEDRFTGAFGTSGSVERGTQQTITIVETVDNITSVAAPVKGAVFFVAKKAGRAIAKGVTKKSDTLRPGPFAKDSIPAHRGRPTASEQKQVNELMNKHGCHTCGTKDPGTKSGNAIADHQPAQALDEPEVFLPHCNHCKARQGGQVLQEMRRRAQQ